MTSSLPTLLVIEDEPEIRRFLRSTLETAGYKVVESTGGRRGLIDIASHKPDIVILDLGLPDVNGLEVIQQVRGWSTVPIVVLSAHADEHTKVQALDAGADDYVVKPFGVTELLARIRVAYRHLARTNSGDSAVQFGDNTIDMFARRVSRAGVQLHLTPIEFRLLACLARYPGRVVTQRQLLTEVWGPLHAKDTHYLRIYMKQLRDKLEPDPARPRYLLTDTGVGYRLIADD